MSETKTFKPGDTVWVATGLPAFAAVKARYVKCIPANVPHYVNGPLSGTGMTVTIGVKEVFATEAEARAVALAKALAQLERLQANVAELESQESPA